MTKAIGARSTKLASVLVLAVCALAMTAAAASAGTVYNNIPSPLPGSMYTVGAQEYRINEIGGQLGLANTERKHPTVEVVMSTKACQYGRWDLNSCETPKPTKKFKWPVTLNVYEVGPGNSPGLLIASVTKKIPVPYRPSSSPANCTGGEWYDLAEAKCYHAMTFVAAFKLGKIGRIPTHVIISVVYNSENAGPQPVGPAQCDATVTGCPYNFLNVAITEPNEKTLTIGTQPVAPDLYLNTENPEYFEQYEETGYIQCYKGPEPFTAGPPIGVSGKFSLNNCLASMQPVLKVTASA
jgi:hypothetical protein